MRYVKPTMKYLLVAFFILSGLNHFRVPDFYTNIMPDYIPYHLALVYISGVTEIVAGVLVAIPATTSLGAWGIIAMMIAFMPVHIHMIVHAERYAAVPVSLLYLRLPVQALFVLWAWWFTASWKKTERATAP